MGFDVGDLVSWKSQAGGSQKRKIGHVIVVVPKWTAPYGVLRDAGLLRSSWTIMFDANQRPEVSYLVEVPSETGRGKPKLYHPSVSKLALEEAP